MELGKLNTHQAILLTLLVSFVTSVATGIVTVSLMEKAPSDITRVINRIIEKPIETMSASAGSAVHEEIVVVREGDLISEAITKVAPAVVRIYRVQSRDSRTFMGLGVITDDQGTVMTGNILNPKDRYTVALSDGTEVATDEISSQSSLQGILKIKPIEGMDVTTFTHVSFAPYDTVLLGETVVALGGEKSLTVSAGIVAELLSSGEGSLVRAGVSGGTISPGSPLIDVTGNVVGILLDEGDMTFLSVVATAGETTE